MLLMRVTVRSGRSTRTERSAERFPASGASRDIHETPTLLGLGFGLGLGLRARTPTRTLALTLSLNLALTLTDAR